MNINLRTTAKYLFLTMILMVIIYMAINGGRNYLGYCNRDNKILSQEEKINIAIESTIASYPPVLEREETRSEDGVQKHAVVFFLPKHPLRYRDVKEFLEINPNCCALVEREPEGMGPDFLDKINGWGSMVRVKYSVRYKTSDGVDMTGKAERYEMVSNCGDPSYMFD